MNVKDLVIVNDCDRPCIQLIAHINASGLAGYLNKDIKSRVPGYYEPEVTMATLEQFGFESRYNTETKDFDFIKLHPSKATYADGRIREWQDKEQFTLSDIYNSEW